MKISNKRNKENYLNFKENGITRKVLISAGKTLEVDGLTDFSQVLNSIDFKNGFFEIVKEKENCEIKNTLVEEEKKEEDSLKKIEKEVKDYIENKEQKK